MFCKITIIRENGELRVPIIPAARLVGDLHLEHRSLGQGERTVGVLRCLNRETAAGKGRELFEPRLTHLSCGSMRFMGWERVGRAWYAQEWECEAAAR